MHFTFLGTLAFFFTQPIIASPIVGRSEPDTQKWDSVVSSLKVDSAELKNGIGKIIDSIEHDEDYKPYVESTVNSINNVSAEASFIGHFVENLKIDGSQASAQDKRDLRIPDSCKFQQGLSELVNPIACAEDLFFLYVLGFGADSGNTNNNGENVSLVKLQNTASGNNTLQSDLKPVLSNSKNLIGTILNQAKSSGPFFESVRQHYSADITKLQDLYNQISV